MSKPIIAIDLDDVLADSTESLRMVVNTTYGLSLEPDHYKVPGEYWKYYERVWQSHGVADKVSKEELNSQMMTDQSHVPVSTDATNVLQELKKRYSLVVLTARNPEWEAATHVWLDMHFPAVFSRVIFGGHRDSTDQKTKGDLCREIGAGWLIDDNPEHCRSALQQEVGALLFGDYGWHKATELPSGLTLVADWQAVGQFFAGVSHR